jgi:hypothetical protein
MIRIGPLDDLPPPEDAPTREGRGTVAIIRPRPPAEGW